MIGLRASYCQQEGGALILCILQKILQLPQLISAHGKLYALIYYRSFLIDTATHRRLVTGDKGLGNVHKILKKLILPRKACNLA